MALIMTLTALLAGCAVNPTAFKTVRGSGVVKTETRPVSGFSRVTFNLVGKLYIDQSGSDSLSITTDENILPFIQTEVRNGMLTIGMSRATNLMQFNDLTYHVSVKNLTELTVSGAADVVVSNLDAESLSVVINGAGKVTASGKAREQTVSINGAGDYNAPNLESRIAKMTHAGLGKALVRVSDSLEVQIDGAGVVEYIGNPSVRKTINGLGIVRQSK